MFVSVDAIHVTLLAIAIVSILLLVCICTILVGKKCRERNRDMERGYDMSYAGSLRSEPTHRSGIKRSYTPALPNRNNCSTYQTINPMKTRSWPRQIFFVNNCIHKLPLLTRANLSRFFSVLIGTFFFAKKMKSECKVFTEKILINKGKLCF